MSTQQESETAQIKLEIAQIFFSKFKPKENEDIKN